MIIQLIFHDNGSLYLTDEPSALTDLLSEGLFAIPVLDGAHAPEEFPHTDHAVTNVRELLETLPADGGNVYLEGRDFIPESLRRIYLRLAGLPVDILETGRLLIRETTVGDVDAFYELYRNPLITRYMEDLYEDPDEERLYTENYIRNIYGFYGFGIWTVIEKASGKIIGRAGLNVREGYDEPELGFMIGVPYQGKGYAKEALRSILAFAKEEYDFPFVNAFVRPGNEASLHLLYELGFRDSGETELDGIQHRILKYDFG
ncbi:MAG: GNAT family N-acetyltransferase [Lachnospiraceae bacterium]|nr:GNAT family N-acetyltransferase [Lachnospiraceae bacterium]